jgi:AcrR family transcriptional regulator
VSASRSATPPVSPRTAGDRRSRIIAEAARLFSEAGYQRTGVEDIANAVGVAKPSLYHYFRSKEAILNAIFLELQELFEPALAEARAADSAAEAITAGMVAIMDLMDSAPGYLRVFFEYHDELEGQHSREQESRQRQVFDHFKHAVIVGIGSGEIRPVDASMVAAACVALCSNSYRWYRPGGPQSGAGIAREFAAFLLQGIVATPHSTST